MLPGPGIGSPGLKARIGHSGVACALFWPPTASTHVTNDAATHVAASLEPQ